MINTDKLKRRLERLKERRDNYKNEHKGNELKYTYWGGYSLGYLEGQIFEIEEILDDLEESDVISGCDYIFEKASKLD
jgi:hypothetical protein